MRYVILVLLNIPIILLALVNIFTQHKLNKVSKKRFQHQLILWSVTMLVLLGSFPVYNIFTGRPVLDSIELSLFDIFQTTAIVTLFYAINSQRQKIELSEKTIRDLHQELSIRLSENEKN